MSQKVGADSVIGERNSMNEAEGSGVSRRNLLAVTGLLAAGSMTGCLDRVASVVTNTDSSPAGAVSGAVAGFGHSPGSGGGKASLAHDIRGGDVEHVPVTIRAGDGTLSSEVSLDGWLTDHDIVPPANDYNSVRSNKRRSAFVPWEDGEDDADDTDEGDVSEELEQLYVYLGDEPVIGERFTVSLPDARLPRGGPAIGDEITPAGIVEYLTGEATSCGVRDEGSLYCWGRNESARLSAELHEEENKHRGVASFAVDGGVCVTGVPAAADGAEEMVALEHCRNAASPTLFKKCRTSSADPDDWGDELTEGDITVSPTFVCPVVAQPDDAPVPFYALLYFTRCRCGDEYIYTGGWLIDDGALYDDSCTLLVAEESPAVVSFTPDDAGNEDTARRKMREAVGDVRRRSQGAVVYDGEIDDEALEHMPDALQDGEGLDGVAELALASVSKRSARTGRNPQTGKGVKIAARDGPVASDDEEAMRCIATALDCPIAHLTQADGLGTAEKVAAYDAFLKIEAVERGSSEE